MSSSSSSTSANACCPVKIALTSQTPNVIVDILNDSGYLILAGLRFSVGPVEAGSARVKSVVVTNDKGMATEKGDVAVSILGCLDSESVVIRFNETLPPGYSVSVTVFGTFGNPVTGCIECFTPQVTGKCKDFVSNERNKANSTPKDIGCPCKICASVCHCNYFLINNLVNAEANLYRLNGTNIESDSLVLVGAFLDDAGSPIGPIRGAAVNPKTGVLYVLGFADGLDFGIFTVNSSNAQAIFVGLSGFKDISSIAFRSTGELYGWAITKTVAGDTQGLVQFNLTTGAATTISVNPLGIGNSPVALGFDANNNLYGKYLDSVDPTVVNTVGLNVATGQGIFPTATSTLTPPPSATTLNSLLFPCGSDGGFYGILIDEVGRSFLQKYSDSFYPMAGTPVRNVATFPQPLQYLSPNPSDLLDVAALTC